MGLSPNSDFMEQPPERCSSSLDRAIRDMKRNDVPCLKYLKGRCGRREGGRERENRGGQEVGRLLWDTAGAAAAAPADSGHWAVSP